MIRRCVDVGEIMDSIAELEKSPWYNNYQNNFERIIRKEAVEMVRDLCVRSAQTVDPVRHGKWEIVEGVVRCSECSRLFSIEWNYCPNCGAKMDGE